jgi:hypothetical protein
VFGNTTREEFLDWLADNEYRPVYAVVAFFARREREEREESEKLLTGRTVDDHLLVRPSLVRPSKDPWDSDYGGKEDGWRRRLDELEAAGLIKDLLDRVSLTEQGRARVNARREELRKADAAYRRAAANRPEQRNATARDAVVRWLYSRPGHEETKADLDSVGAPVGFPGDPLVAAELAAAVRYLAECGLVAAPANVEQYRLTRKGIDCVERFDGSVRKYMEYSSGEDHSVTIHGHVGNAMWGPGKQEATMNITVTGATVADLVPLLRAIAEAVPVLGLSPEDASRLTRDVQVIEAELVDEGGSTSRVRTLLNRALTTLGETANSSLALILSAYAKELIRKLGIQIE